MHVGDRFAGRYRMVRPLGSGGMAEVFLAEDERLGRQVAVKLLPPQLHADAAAIERILREARAVAALSHPNVVAVYDVLEEPEAIGIVLEVIEGKNLGEILDEGRLPIPTIVRIIEDVSAGVAAAHARGIVHRDLKPSNVLLTDDGVAKVADFGIAAVLDETVATRTIRGSVPYVAPEQATGGRPDARADVYGLGCLLFQLITGEPPYTGTTMEVLGQHLHAPIPRPSARRPDVPKELDDLVVRSLAKDPADRPADAAELATAIGRLGISTDTPGNDATLVIPPVTSDTATTIVPSLAGNPAPADRPTDSGRTTSSSVDRDHRGLQGVERRRMVRRVLILVGIVAIVWVLLVTLSPNDTPSAGPNPGQTATPLAPPRTPTPAPSPKPQPDSLEGAIEAIAVVVAEAPSSSHLTAKGIDKLESRIRELRAELRRGPPRERPERIHEQLDKLDEDVDQLFEDGEMSVPLYETLQELVDQARDLTPDAAVAESE